MPTSTAPSSPGSSPKSSVSAGSWPPTQNARLGDHSRNVVRVQATDYAPGDPIRERTGTRHRFASLQPYPPTSDLARRHLKACRYVCADGHSMPAASHGHGMRADRAPAGCWRRTGNQLLPAD
ncbi:hypothetical protein [Streptomyces sp. SYSU K21746]